MTIDQIYGLKERLGLSKHQNVKLQFDELQNQILISGKLGDGNFKKNGSSNYYYRESHAEDELEYLRWKMLNLGDAVTPSGIVKIKRGGFNVQQLYGFQTITTPSLIKYAEMSTLETIQSLDYRGIIMFMLDDGTFSKHTKYGYFKISGGVLTDDELLSVCNKLEDNKIGGTHITGNKNKEIVIPSRNNTRLLSFALSFMPRELDVIQKKFGTILNNQT